MNLKADLIIGKNVASEWSGVFGYISDSSENKEEMFVIMRLASDIDGEGRLESLAKILFDSLQDNYFNPKKKYVDNTERLEDAIWQMKVKMEHLLSRESDISEKGLDIELSCLISTGEDLYIGIIGESKVYIMRGDSFADLTGGLIDGNMMGFSKIGSLLLQESDRFLISTSKMALTKSEDDIKDVIQSLAIHKFKDLKEKSGVSLLLLADELADWAVESSETVLKVDEVAPIPSDIPKNDDELVEEFAEEYIKNEIPEPLYTPESPISLVEEGFEDDELEEIENNTPLKERLTEIGSKAKDKALTLRTALFTNSKSIFNNLKGKVSQFRSKGKDLEEGDEEVRIENEEEDDYDYEEDEIEGETLLDKIKIILNKIRVNLVNLFKKIKSSKALNNSKTYSWMIREFVNRVKKILDNLYKIFQREIIGTDDRINRVKRARRLKRNRYIFIVTLAILFVVMFISIRDRQTFLADQDRINKATDTYNSIKSRQESISLEATRSASDSQQKKELILDNIETLVDEAEEAKKSNLFKDQLDIVIANLNKSSDQLMLAQDISNPTIQVDVGKTYPDAVLTDLEYSAASLFISDSSRNLVYKVPSVTPSTQPESHITGLVQPYLLVKDVDDNIIVYDNDSNAPISKFSPATAQSLTRFSGLTLAGVGKPLESSLYAGNNALYEIRGTTKQIFKRTQQGDSYINGGAVRSEDGSSWKIDENEFGNALDISAPYEVYVLIKNIGLRRYFAGGDNTIARETYINMFDQDFEALKNATSFDVKDNYLAIGDKINRRVLLFTIEDNDQKTLRFTKQYVYRGKESIFNDINEIVVVPSENSIFVLDGTKVIKLAI